MTPQTLLDRLQKVRSQGPNRWMACCPAHDDKNPSLAIKEEPDGRVLIHCFAGCGAVDVLAAIGLQMTDIMPESCGDHRAPWWADQRKEEPERVRIARNILSVVNVDLAMGRPVSNRSKKEFLAAWQTVRQWEARK